MRAGVIAGVFFSMKYFVPVMLPFIFGWLLALLVRPAGKWVIKKCAGRRIRIRQSLVETVFVVLVLMGIGAGIVWGIREILNRTERIFTLYFNIKEEAVKILGTCCQKAETITGISADSSRRYLCEQMGFMWEKIWNRKNPAEIAKNSLKICTTVIGGGVLTVVSAVLFIQERESLEKILDQWKFGLQLKLLLRNIGKGISSYIKAQIKIMGLVIFICIAGFYLIGIHHFLLYGVLIGLLDAFPVLGTGTFLIPAAIILIIKGNTGMAAGCIVLYFTASGIRQFLEPRLIGKKIGASPLVVLLSFYLGVFAYGWKGVLFGPLSALLIYGIFREWQL